jgi:hypothetical protein
MLKCGRCRCCEECKKLDDEIMNAEKCLKCSDECLCLCNLEKYDSKLDNPDILSNSFMIGCGNKLHQTLINIIREQDKKINDFTTKLMMIERINEVNISQEIYDRLIDIEDRLKKYEIATPRETPRNIMKDARDALLSPTHKPATPKPSSSRIIRF